MQSSSYGQYQAQPGQRTITEESAVKQDSTIQTHHLNALSNQAPSSKTNGNPPHLFSCENSSSMVMYNATVRNQGTGAKTDTSAGVSYPVDPNSHFS